jgi:membrane-bound lytic murein transglycosylase B
MRNLSIKHLFTLALAISMLSCSSTRPVIYPPTPTTPTTPTTSITKPPAEVGSYSAATLSGTYANSVALQSFIQRMVQQYGFSQTYLNGLFSQVNHLNSVVKLENPPASQLVSSSSGTGSWSRYRQQFLDEAHINNGVQFWRDNASTLQKASSTYAVDPEYIVAIIGVETFYGRNVGKTRTLDALTTLAFDTQRRAAFFTSELENFLLITREEKYEPLAVVGSWAGAMGLGQFMPSSFRNLAVDFNNDGKRDLWQPADAIGSVANYFSKNGWQLHGTVAAPSNQPDPFSTIELGTYSGSEFWSVYPNFKVIKKYNSNDKYAMAVHQLAQACKQRYQ